MSSANEKIDFGAFVKYSKSGPRYTSYPTAVEFKESWNEQAYIQALSRADSMPNLPFSIYVHLPFCRSACYYCGCNVVYTSKEEKKQRYIEYFKKEIALLARYMDTTREVVQFHFGGGTPTFFNAKELQEIISIIRGTFTRFSPTAEISCEIDPRFFVREQMAVLKENGFNRLSFGVQDFEEKVQEAVHRKQSVELVSAAITLAREFGINSVNFDLIYGLPFQNEQTFARTLEKVVQLSPDRLAIFNYAHLPWMKKTMRKIDETTLPSPAQKLEILKNTISFLQKQDYAMIGMDHFAKKSDELYLAKQHNQLRRNFQGYTTRGFSQTIGIGLTSISEGLDYYSQNYKDMNAYESALDNGRLPVERGVKLTDEDILRKEVIMGLMNNLCLDFSDIESKFGIDFKAHFAPELESLREYEEIGLVQLTPQGISTSPTGGMLIRNIAMAFDAYLCAHSDTKRFSKTI
ncbi:oxygen-independent coproporphyrinogen III oxidase [Helicobacter sp. MIT 21-1697]|uniref:oxygen-independent coproporphyrinogen III oxidase n=1 Tax=Helicobacter sp. MIT 21-1697 TaxID=2993733 RepID=UPI00224A8896|nr:oxygen-independent coproporphyrinogen III oxidase [Helicobacter sp. MIT 21-1697]MCX2717783.1 oxygen-independent coproporphyrinogen III oxidase [Helicobacter sp. MIT 21-1697]